MTLLAVEEAQARLLALRSPLPAETIPLHEAVNRHISTDFFAKRNQPAAPISAMDGYAIRFDDRSGPWTLVGESAAGQIPSRTVGTGEAMRIFTGALLPPGADTVVIQEMVEATGNLLHLTGNSPLAIGANIRAKASDFAHGDRLLTAGARLTPGAIAAAAMGGAGYLAIVKQPRIALLTTGDELVPPGEVPGPGQIPNSNAAMLRAMLAGEAALISLPCHAPDDRLKLSIILQDLARHHDVIITVGGASVGDHDHVRGAIGDAGGTIDFWRIAMRPGKPLLAGKIGDTIILGLPGNPSSAFVTAILFLLPLLRHLSGSADPLPPIHKAPLRAPLAAGGARRDYLRARLMDGEIDILSAQDSGMTHPLITANALVLRDIDAQAAPARAMARYIPI